MKDFLEALFKLVTYDVIWGKLGISQGLGDILAGIINTGLVALLTLCTKSLAASIRNYRTACSLRPYFSYRDIKLARRFFIPTRFQNESPAREDEPRVILKFIASIPLITHMIRTAFNEKKEDDRFYLVLADSGMGKTTFMINLYIQYTRFFHLGSRHKIRLFPLGDSRVLEKIKNIPQEEAAKTILLLDALDEDPVINIR